MSISLKNNSDPIATVVRRAMGEEGVISYPKEGVSLEQVFTQAVYIEELDQHLFLNQDYSLIVPAKILLTKLATRVEEIRAKVMGLLYQKSLPSGFSANSSSTTASVSISPASSETSSNDPAVSSSSSDSAPQVLTMEEKVKELYKDIAESLLFIDKIAGKEDPSLNRKEGLLNKFCTEKHNNMNFFQRMNANAFTEERESTSRLIRGFNECESQLLYASGKLRWVASV